jgi:hypothetical protein
MLRKERKFGFVKQSSTTALADPAFMFFFFAARIIYRQGRIILYLLAVAGRPPLFSLLL